MAELTSYKARISMACSSISGLEDKVRNIDRAFTFPDTGTECNAFIADKMAEMDELQISLTGLFENLEAQVQTSMNFLGSKKDQSDKDRLMSDLATFLSTEANGLQLEGIHHWTNRLKYRRRELEKQTLLVQNHNLSKKLQHPSPLEDTIADEYSSTRQSSVNKMRLPQLEVPTFDGSYKEYPTFWTIYNSLIHSNRQLSNVDKFFFLRQALKGTAASLLGNMPVIGENYDKAILLLDKRFNKSGCIADLLITELERLPRAEEDAHSCRKALISVTEKLNHIECAGVPLDNNRMWRRLILSKFPNSLNEKVLCKEQNVGESFTTEKILDVLENAVALKETLAFTTSEDCDITARSDPDQKVDERQNYGEDSIAYNSKGGQGRTSPRDSSAQCICGSYQHDAMRCATFQTAAERRDEARKQRLCFKCLQTDHRISDCTSSQSCYKCHGNHHTAVCMNGYLTHKDIPTRRSRQRSAYEQHLPRGQEFVQNSEVLHKESKAKRGGMQHVLMTATALAYDHTSTTYKPVTVFFDGGAQKSFINTRKTKSLGLPVLRNTTFKIGGFGGSTAQFTSKEVPLTLKTGFYGAAVKSVKMHTKSSLTSAMSTAWLSLADRRLIRKRKIRIAQPDLKKRRFTPDILIGQDLTDEFILRNKPCTTLPSGLILTPTVFGHAISGSSRVNEVAVAKISQNTAITVASASTHARPLSIGNPNATKSSKLAERAASRLRPKKLNHQTTRQIPTDPVKLPTKSRNSQRNSVFDGLQLSRRHRKSRIHGQPMKKNTDAQQGCFAPALRLALKADHDTIADHRTILRRGR